MNRSHFAVIVNLLCLAIPLIQGQNLVELSIRTSDTEGAGMNGQGSITIYMLNVDGRECNISSLTNALGNDDGAQDKSFEQGATTVLSGPLLQTCQNFPVPERRFYELIITHLGEEDFWRPAWYELAFDDGTSIRCLDDDTMDGFEVHEIERECA